MSEGLLAHLGFDQFDQLQVEGLLAHLGLAAEPVVTTWSVMLTFLMLHTHTCIYIYVYISIYVYIYIYIYM